ncbi:MAG: PQQ-binding-like beta-propeller repeat protein, partial [Phycisphaerae bacterium]
VWSAARGFFRTIAAVTDELVILTGHKSLTGLKVEDGSVAWSSELPDGQIAGVSGNSGGILVVPSTSGAIHYYEMSSGKYLFSGQLPASTRAGNVLMMHGRIYLQEMTSICALAPASDAEPMTAADRAGSLLL